MTEKIQCWVCSGNNLEAAKQSGVSKEAITATDFQITDAHYGSTLDIYRCSTCGFLQCPDASELVQYYEDMEDSIYEDTRDERALQAKKLIELVVRHKASGRLLDIGASSGILCEEAIKKGFDVLGVEPSRYLHAQAQKRQLPVILGTIPHPEVQEQYDIITLIDVIEHVSNPVELLSDISQLLAPGGIFVTVTPDVNSVAARIMRWQWWHYRIAHVGYFNKKTLNMSLHRAGLEATSWYRPTWYFPASYLYQRVMTYLPTAIRHKAPAIFDRWVVPLNLYDSYLVICRKI